MCPDNHDNPSDLELIADANHGSSRAMEALYNRYRSWVFAMAMRLTGNAHDAADVLQDVFAYFFSRFPGFVLTCKLKTFLYPAVRNTALNLLRKRRRNAAMGERFADALESSDHGDRGHRLRLLEWVETLDDDQRELVMLRFHDGNSLQEISELLSVPLGTVKSRLHRALSQLRETLDAE